MQILGVAIILFVMAGLSKIIWFANNDTHFQWEGVVVTALLLGFAFALLIPDKFLIVLTKVLKALPFSKE